MKQPGRAGGCFVQSRLPWGGTLGRHRMPRGAIAKRVGATVAAPARGPAPPAPYPGSNRVNRSILCGYDI